MPKYTPERLNQTRLDAVYRLADARAGALASDPVAGPPSDEYLDALERGLHVFLELVQEERARRVKAAADQQRYEDWENSRVDDEDDYDWSPSRDPGRENFSPGN